MKNNSLHPLRGRNRASLIALTLILGSGGGPIMIFFFVVGAGTGILLGLRFNIFALVPTMLIAIVGIVWIEHELRVIVFTVVGTVVLLQLGYIGGCVLPAMLVHFGFTSDRRMNQRDQAETLKS